MVTQCFYDKTRYDAYKSIKNYKAALLRNKERISVTDLGAGSRVHKHPERTIASIAKYAGTSTKRSKLLYRLVTYLNCSSILELGTSLGIATRALSLANPKASITSIEGCQNIATFTKRQLQNDNIEIIGSDFGEYLQTIKKESFDLIFFDGNHQKEATLNYFESLLPTAHNDSVFIFDDIHWSKGMTEAWDLIKQHPRVAVTIDTFKWGFVFFRKEQAKEHFSIRV
ncbi:class I SAM-dependent methyltransferase [Snuella lapsa]|uniref:Class I SAM-dependent methyltransferase n=1 Tax=Snuella lapsa TaxID=870481 RepID=A0ABP6YL96_9FLAO